MTSSKLREVIGIYRQYFEANEIGKINFPHEEILNNSKLGLEHCHGMLDQMLIFIDNGRFDKTYRWLGFIQGVLWVNRIYTLDDLKNQNRPDSI